MLIRMCNLPHCSPMLVVHVRFNLDVYSTLISCLNIEICNVSFLKFLLSVISIFRQALAVRIIHLFFQKIPLNAQSYVWRTYTYKVTF